MARKKTPPLLSHLLPGSISRGCSWAQGQSIHGQPTAPGRQGRDTHRAGNLKSSISSCPGRQKYIFLLLLLLCICSGWICLFYICIYIYIYVVLFCVHLYACIYINIYKNIDLCAFLPRNPSSDPRSCITRHRNKGLAEGTEIFFPLSIHSQPFPGSRFGFRGVLQRVAPGKAEPSSRKTHKKQNVQENTTSGLFQERGIRQNETLPCTEKNSEVSPGGLGGF